MRTTFITTLGALLTAVSGLTFTSPSAGSVVDPSKAITVTWTSSGGDPATFDILLGGSPQGATVLASSVSTSSGSYTIPAEAIHTWGQGYSFQAQSGGSEFAQSGSFALYVQTASTPSQGGGGLSVFGEVSTTANPGSPASTASSAATSSNPVIVSSHNTGPTSAVSSGSAASTGSSTSSFSTRTTSRSTSTSASTSSASATTSANAQPRLASNSQIALGAAGFLTGLVALLA